MTKVQAQQVQQQVQGLKTRLEVALQQNAALEPHLQLSADELCLNSMLRYYSLRGMQSPFLRVFTFANMYRLLCEHL